MALSFPFHRSGRRGVAIISVIAILGVLTILLTALAASQEAASIAFHQSQSRHQSRVLAQFGLESGQRLLARDPGRIVGQSVRLGLEEGACVVGARPLDPGAACYKTSLLKHREGDMELTVEFEPGSRSLVAVRQVYLVNLSPNHGRLIRLQETMGG
ncbi:hypothetical protein HQ520_04985 [bacterium]|nr:hypothetical protein [bacterium]